jgi:hypothetical protein
MSASAVAGGSPEGRALRWVVGVMLLAGGTLALIAAFLPFMRTEWPAINGDPAGGVTMYLIRQFLTSGSPPEMGAVNIFCGGLLLLGAPFGLATLGAAILWARRWALRRRAFLISFPLVALGTFYLLANAAMSSIPVWDSGIGTRRLEYGAGVMLLGYLLALAGTVLLPFITPLSPGEAPLSPWERGRG